MSNPGWGLSPDSMDRVWPFHFVLDQDLSICQAGAALSRLEPGTGTGRLADVLEVVTPGGAVTWESLTSRPRSLFVMKLKHSDVTLRGQMVLDDERQVITFLGSPWITDLSSIADLGLTLEDFSVADSMVDHLLLLQTQGVALSEARRLAGSPNSSSTSRTSSRPVLGASRRSPVSSTRCSTQRQTASTGSTARASSRL